MLILERVVIKIYHMIIGEQTDLTKHKTKKTMIKSPRFSLQ